MLTKPRHGVPKAGMGRKPESSVAVRDGGIVVTVDEGGPFRHGDRIEALVGDALLGSASLERPARTKRLTGTIPLRDVGPIAFPARVRVVDTRSDAEIGRGVTLAGLDALLAAAGPPAFTAGFAGMHPDGPAFEVTPDRLPLHPRRYALHLDGVEVAAATGVPGEDGVQRVAFALASPLAAGQRAEVFERAHGVRAFAMAFDAATALAAATAQVARLQGEVTDLRTQQAALRRRLDLALDLGREALLLERLDLFYLLLSERIEREVQRRDPPPREPPPRPPEVTRFGPADVEGVGIFEVESDGSHEWRWFGPACTIALRDIAARARRVVLYFHTPGETEGPPGVRVSVGGAAEPASVRALESGFAIDVPLRRSHPWPDNMLILHIAFDRHRTSDVDRRLLSAVFSGAEVACDP